MAAETKKTAETTTDIEIGSSNGTIVVNSEGYIVSLDKYDDDDALLDIIRFDLPEHRDFWSRHDPDTLDRECYDILDMGYWAVHAQSIIYVEAVDAVRQRWLADRRDWKKYSANYEVSLIETTYRRATITVESTSKDSALCLAESRVKEGDWEYREKTVDAVEAFVAE
tara:strand:- start:4939 stop:5442 length:504 start_codon:yes stop_codon:yes gene_type:complete